jgi:hypothetical protein
MLSEREQRQLADIEYQLAMDDPDFVRIMRGRHRDNRLRRRVATAGTLLVWVIATAVAVAGNFGIVGDVLMAAASAAVVTMVTVRIIFRVRRRTYRLAA